MQRQLQLRHAAFCTQSLQLDPALPEGLHTLLTRGRLLLRAQTRAWPLPSNAHAHGRDAFNRAAHSACPSPFCAAGAFPPHPPRPDSRHAACPPRSMRSSSKPCGASRVDRRMICSSEEDEPTPPYPPPPPSLGARAEEVEGRRRNGVIGNRRHARGYRCDFNPQLVERKWFDTAGWLSAGARAQARSSFGECSS